MDYLKKLRRQMFLTRVEFGRQLGVSRQTVRNWEEGITHPSITHKKKIIQLCVENNVPVNLSKLSGLGD